MGSVASRWATAPSDFVSTKKVSEVCPHSVPRSGSLRRQLGIPNPVAYANLCREIDDHWAEIENHLSRADLTKSSPTFFTHGARAVLPAVPNQADLIPFRAAARAAGRFVLTTDISRFYSSIYTHSVPWAIHTRAAAKKAKQDYTLLGNRLDRWLRNMQDGQTMGVPIGPDASLVVAEVVLAAIDADLQQLVRTVGLRYIDDYELVFKSTAEAEEALARLEHRLTLFGLEPNPKKTRIESLPIIHEFRWSSALRSLPLRAAQQTQARDLLRIFDVAFEFAKENPDEHVLRYTVARFRGTKWKDENWKLFQHLLLQAVLAEPATLPAALGYLVAGRDDGRDLQEDLIHDVLNSLIERHAPLGQGNEAAWSVWGLMTLGLPFESATVSALETTTDCATILLCLHAREVGMLSSAFDVSLWEQMMTTEDLSGSNWLVAYEASIKGWLPSLTSNDHIVADRRFAWLRDNLAVSVYDETKIHGVHPTGVAPSIGVAPMFSP